MYILYQRPLYIRYSTKSYLCVLLYYVDEAVRLAEQEEVHHIEVTPRATSATPTQKQKKDVICIYCQHGFNKETLQDLVEILELCSHIVLHIDLTETEFPSNWNRWVEKQITSCDYVLLICTRELHDALTADGNTNVEMFMGRFNSNAIIDCIPPSKIIPVFINCSEDRSLIPMRLHDRKTFKLDLTYLSRTVQQNEDSLQHVITYNSDFIAFRELFELLQK